MRLNLRSRAKNIADKAVTATKDTTNAVQEIAQTEDAKEVGRNFKEMAKDALTSDTGKHAAAGAAAGAVIGSIVPFGGPILGAQLGLAYGVYKGITK